MRRREFIIRFGGAAAVWPLAAHAQQPVKVARIGFLATAPFDTPEFRQARPFLPIVLPFSPASPSQSAS